MENNDKKIEGLKKDLAKQNRKLFISSCVTAFITVAFYLCTVLVAGFTLEENNLAFGVVMCIAFVILLVGLLFSFVMEVNAGYHECRNCGHKFVPTYKEAILAAHTPTKKYLKCPECGKKTWAKKVMSK